MARLARLLLLLLVIGGLTAGLWTYRWYGMALPAPPGKLVFEVEQGAPLARTATTLAAAGVLDHPRLWTWLARLAGSANKIRAGEFEFVPGTTPRGLLEQLVAGHVLLHSVTLVEGWTLAQALAALRSEDAIQHTAAGKSATALMTAIGEPALHAEGQFFPDTYHYARGTRDSELLAIAHQRLTEELAQAWNVRAKDLPLTTPYQALILASIIEKETGVADERPRIAAVFINRLRQGMRLQTDPTVIYGLGARFDGNLRRVDLQTDTPYNTYTRSGLPPTPIALVGRESLRAAVNPATSEEIYFVATGAGDGRHQFSRTLAEHEAAVQRYLQRIRGLSTGRASETR